VVQRPLDKDGFSGLHVVIKVINLRITVFGMVPAAAAVPTGSSCPALFGETARCQPFQRLSSQINFCG
jgi:hypothetical protein